MELVSFGDRLESGVYTLHSSFDKVINFKDEEKIISLVTCEIGGGPNNIVLNDKVVGSTGGVRIEKGNISIGSHEINLDPSRVYRSKLGCSEINRATLLRGIDVLRKLVDADPPQNSIAFLLKEKANAIDTSSYNQAFQRRIRSGWEHLRRGNSERGISLLMGSGYGLTPAGDDFLTGYLSGLFLEEKYFGKNCTHIRDRILSWSVKTNVLSRTFIRYAYDGCFYERSKGLILAIVGGVVKVIERSYKSMCGFGATSGTDFTVGLLCVFL